MSYSALEGSEHPYTCEICGRELKDGERCWIALRTEVNFIKQPTTEDEKASTLDPDCEWFVNLDWDKEYLFHIGCFAKMITNQ